ncbi:tetratricopeptide repeat protein [Micromonospora sp. NPDC049559]|uniref:tetratricopeptide repeat protein n=1 Tax=Micromonospora sp. NPDC049559 TaxID=3155923 RepID=UPI00343382F7
MDDPRLSAEGELALARLALGEGDLRHAAEHLAGAIVHTPTLPEVHEVLAQLAARADGGVELFPLDQHHAFIGAVVARAHLLAAAGHPADGLELLAAATSHAPAVDWAGVPWVGAPDLPGRVTPDRIARILMQVCAAVPDPVAEDERGPLLPYLRLARHTVAAYPRHGLLLGAASALARRLGETDLAVTWATRGVRESPSKLAEVWLGYAYRSAGRTADALAALRRAVDHDPADLSVYADIAGTLADNGRLDEAIDWIDQALARDPTFDCAVHTGHRLRYQRDGELAQLVALADFQRDHPDDSHEHNDLAECCHGQPWLGQVPAAGEAVINVLRQVLAADGPATDGQLRLSGLEPPSAMRAMSAALPGLDVAVAAIPTPDIREPRRPSSRRLWRYDGPVAVPLLPAPSEAAVERIRRLAHPAWPHPPAAYDSAVSLATLPLDDLLGLLVHPPAPPESALGRALTAHDPALWVRCVQVWACLGLLHHNTDEPWPDSTRRRVLVDLVWGVEDWVTEAALFALLTAAWVDPSIRADVAAVAAERLADGIAVARHRPVSIVRSLAHLALATPDLDPVAATRARRVLASTNGPGPEGRLRRLWRRLTGRG